MMIELHAALSLRRSQRETIGTQAKLNRTPSISQIDIEQP
jgi:hypothetical protein